MSTPVFGFPSIKQRRGSLANPAVSRTATQRVSDDFGRELERELWDRVSWVSRYDTERAARLASLLDSLSPDPMGAGP